MALQPYVLHTTAAPATCKRPFFDPAVKSHITAGSQPACLPWFQAFFGSQPMYVLDDDYGNTVMVRAHTSQMGRWVWPFLRIIVFVCVCITYLQFKHAYIHSVLRILK